MEAATKEKTRQSGIEILRIVAMMMIVLHHLCINTNDPSELSINYVWLKLGSLGGRMSVSMFVMITGYFYMSKFSVKKALKLILQTTFYSIALTGLAVICGISEMRLKMIPRALFPLLFTGQHYWFITIFMLLYLLTPVLGEAMKKIKSRMLGLIIITLFCLWSVFPYTIDCFLNIEEFGYSHLTWFILMYFIGAFIRKNTEKIDSLKCVVLLVGVIVIYVSSCILNVIGLINNEALNVFITAFSCRYLNGISGTIIAALLVAVVCKWNPSVPKWVYSVSAATFGVYLLHNHQLTLEAMWHEWLKTSNYVESRLFIPLSLACVAIVYGICTVIDILRKKYLEDKLFMIPQFDKLLKKIDCWLSEE